MAALTDVGFHDANVSTKERQRRAAMAHTSLSILGVLQEASLFTYTKYGIQATNTSGPAQEILDEKRWIMRA